MVSHKIDPTSCLALLRKAIKNRAQIYLFTIMWQSLKWHLKKICGDIEWWFFLESNRRPSAVREMLSRHNPIMRLMRKCEHQCRFHNIGLPRTTTAARGGMILKFNFLSTCACHLTCTSIHYISKDDTQRVMGYKIKVRCVSYTSGGN